MNNRGLVGMIVIVGVVLVVGFFWFVGQTNGGDEKCVPASCCHATECVLESEAPDCNETICTMNCEPGTLDCGQANCEFIDDKCEVVLNE
jgi:hypothetical protein